MNSRSQTLASKTGPASSQSFQLDDEEVTGAFKTILLLEDEEALGDIIKNFLEENLYRVTWVKDGVEGIKQIMHSEYDCILCDVMMPNFPGDMFYLAVQRINADMCKRFIFMTGHRGYPKVDQFLRQVKALTLYKPFLLSDLLDNAKLVVRKTHVSYRNS